MVAFDDYGWDVEAPETRRNTDSTLSATDDEDIRLGGVAKVGLLALATLEPGGAVLVCTMVDTHVACEALFFFVARKLLEGSEELPCFAISQTEASFPASNIGGKCEPGVDDTIRNGGVTF